ncbi:MAG: discoidin domain-containing protein [Alloprevotella sp.]
MSAQITEGVCDRSAWTLSSPAAPTSAIEGATGDGRLEAAIDGNESSYYHSDWSGSNSGSALPQYFIIDTSGAAVADVQGFVYLPRPANGNGTSSKMRVYFSDSEFDVSGGVTADALTGKGYTPAADVTFSYPDGREYKAVGFTAAQSGRYVLVVSDVSTSGTYFTCAEFYLSTDILATCKELATKKLSPLENYSSLTALGFTEDYYANAWNTINAVAVEGTDYATACNTIYTIAATAKTNILNTLRTGKHVVTFSNQSASTDSRHGLKITAGTADGFIKQAYGTNSDAENTKWTLKFNADGTFKLYNVAWNVYLGNASGNAQLSSTASDGANYSFVVRSTANVVSLKDASNNILHQANTDNYKLMAYNNDDVASNWLMEAATLSNETTERMWSEFNTKYTTEKNRAYSYYQAQYGLVTSGDDIQVVVNHSSGSDSQPSSNLLDGNASTYVHSSYGSDAGSDPHYIQVKLSSAQEKVMFYMSRRNVNNRPRNISVYVSNDGATFSESPVAEITNLEGRTSVQDCFSPEIDLGGSYQYLRFVVTATNTGTQFFTASEFYVLPINEETSKLAKMAGATPSTLRAISAEILGAQPIADLSQLDLSKVYTIKPQEYATRGVLYAPADAEQLTACGGSAGNAANKGVAIDATSPAQQFAFVKAKEKYYVYSVSEKKFMTNASNKAKINYLPADYVTVDPASLEEYFIIKFNGSNFLNVSTGYGDDGCAVTNWNSEDGGNRLLITPVSNLASASLPTAEELTTFAEGCIDLKAHLATINANSKPVGEGLGKYTASVSNYNATAEALNTFYNGITSETTTADLTTNVETAASLAGSTFTLNQPEAGKFYRFKGATHNRRIYSSSVTVGTNQILEMGDDTESNISSSVFYYDGTHLISYKTGRAIGSFISTDKLTWNLVEAGATGATYTFGEGSIIGTYTLTANGSRNLYNGFTVTIDGVEHGYVDAAGNSNTAELYCWTIQDVEYLPVNVNYGSAKYSTLISPVDLKLRDNIFAYTAEIAGEGDNRYLHLNPVTGVIPHGTPVVLKVNDEVDRGADDHVYLQVTSGSETKTGTALTGGYETILTTSVSGTIYTLQNPVAGIGFYPFSGDTLAGFKAYMPNGSGVRSFLFHEDGTETAIDGIESITPAPEQPIFDLSGRRVQKAGKGLYIVGGKKVFFK